MSCTDIIIYIAYILAAYLVGAFQFMVLVGKLKGLDLTRERDLHEYLLRNVGKAWGIAGFIVDVLKGVIAVLAGYLLQFPAIMVVLGALAAIAGQMWPVFKRFDGERGNTVGTGVVITLSLAYGAPAVFIIAISIVVVGLIIRTINRLRQQNVSLKDRIKLGKPSNIFPLAVITGFASCVITSAIWRMPAAIIWGFAGLLLLLLLRRVTGGLRQDLQASRINTASVIINRLLYDRSEI